MNSTVLFDSLIIRHRPTSSRDLSTEVRGLRRSPPFEMLAGCPLACFGQSVAVGNASNYPPKPEEDPSNHTEGLQVHCSFFARLILKEALQSLLSQGMTIVILACGAFSPLLLTWLGSGVKLPQRQRYLPRVVVLSKLSQRDAWQLQHELGQSLQHAHRHQPR